MMNRSKQMILGILIILWYATLGYSTSIHDIQQWKEEKNLPELINALSSEDWQIAATAQEAIQEIGEEAIPALADTLRDSNSSLTFYVVNALVSMGDVILPELELLSEDAYPSTRELIAEICGELGSSASMDLLLKLSEDTSPQVRRKAAMALFNREFGMAPRYRLIEMLEDVDAEVVAAALISLQYRFDIHLINPYLDLLTHESESIVEQTMVNLVEAGEAVHSYLLNALQEREAEVRKNIAWILGISGNPQTALQLCDHIADPYPMVRLQVVVSIGDTGDRSREPCLIEGLRDGEPIVRTEVFNSLAKIGAQNSYNLMELAILEDEEEVALAAIFAVGKLGLIEGQDLLIEQLNHPSVSVRYAAIWSLGELECQEATQPLMAIIEQRESSLLVIAAKSLSQIGDERAIRSLQDLLLDPYVDQSLNHEQIRTIRNYLYSLQQQN